MLVGDDVKKVAEAADHAKKLIGCKIMQNKPYYRTAGHVQVRLAHLFSLYSVILPSQPFANLLPEGVPHHNSLAPMLCREKQTAETSQLAAKSCKSHRSENTENTLAHGK